MKRGLVFLLAILWVVPAAAQEKRALLIGINDYTHGPERWDLRGCENDVQMTSEMLMTRFGFPQENIKTLLSAEATRDNIVDAIESWLIEPSGDQDIVYFHFSGHGAQVTDEDGDEVDNKDEMICPADMRRGDRSSVITDDQLDDLLRRIPTANVTVVLDACHSGTGTRDLALSTPRFADFEDRSVVVSAAKARPVKKSDPAKIVSQQKKGKLVGSGGMEGGELRVTISGCDSNQTSADAFIGDGFYAGALTYNLTRNLKAAPPDMSYNELMELVVRDVKAQYTQTPQIDGPGERAVMGTPVATVADKPFAVVQSAAGGRARLAVGHSQGATVGSIWKVFDADETSFSTKEKAKMRLVEVAENASEAVVLDGAIVAEGDRAVEYLHRIESDQLKILLEAPSAVEAPLRRSLGQYDFVRLVRPGQFFDHRLIVRSVSGKLEARLTIDGQGGTPVVGATAQILAAEMGPQLENAFAIRFLADFENPNPSFGVEVWANRVAAGQDDALDEAPDEKQVDAQVGDVIRFNFRTERDCYLTLINVGTSGRVTVLFPNQYRKDGFIEAGKIYRTGTKGEMPFKIRAQGPAGRELVKVIATLGPLNLQSLKMGQAGGLGTRSIESGSQFAQQLTRDLAIEGLEEDGGGDLSLLPTENWATDYLIIETTP